MAKEIEVGKYVRLQIAYIAKDDSALGQSGAKARLAQLRRGVGKEPGELPELWGIFLMNMPEGLMGKNGRPSYAERAIYTALTLFAFHQQGHANLMNAEGEENRLGRAVRKLVKNGEEEENIRLKFSISAKSDDMAELSYHFKTMVKLLADSDIKLDYVDLAKDLYWFQFDEYADRVRLKWGQDFYRKIKQEENGEEEYVGK